MGFILRFFPSIAPYRWLIELALLVALWLFGVVLGWHYKDMVDRAVQLVAQKAEVRQGNKENAKDAQSAQIHEAARDKQAAIDRRVVQKVAIIATAPDYQTCRLKPEDLLLLNQAIGGTP